MSENVFEVENLSLYYLGRFGDKTHAVTNVSFSMKQGEILGIAGESGCGKSTLVSGLMGMCIPPLYPEGDGDVRVKSGDKMESLMNRSIEDVRKNVLAQGLAAAFNRPEWDISFYINTDAQSLIGTDTFEDGRVKLRSGPILETAQEGGFGVLDEINMAKNESLAVLHATLDFRRIIDVPGYERISLHPATRFIGTMNYGYAGTREINEALASRFMIIQMPVITRDNLEKLIRDKYPSLKKTYAAQFAQLFDEIQKKCEGGEISTKALDLRGLLAAIGMMDGGLPVVQALNLGITNKCFDAYERQLVADLIAVRFPGNLSRDQIFD